MNTITKEMQVYYTTYGFRNFKKKGNSRFINNLKANRNLLQQANDTAEGQHPFAVVLSCIDSRASAELILTKGLEIYLVFVCGQYYQ
jgi:carbonic anhydrase